VNASDARTYTIVALFDELEAQPELLAAYVDTFGDADDVTLAVFAPGEDGVRAGERLEQLLAGTSFGTRNPDVLVQALPATEESAAWVSANSHALYTEREPALRGLPTFGRAQLPALRQTATARSNWRAPSAASGADVVAKALAVEGQTSPEECLLLYRYASEADGRAVVEVGSYRGRSTAALALGARAAASETPVFAVEPHERFTGILGGEYGPNDRIAFFGNLLDAGVVDMVRLVNLSSETVTPGWRKPIYFLWVDGDHTYEGVKRDFECWEPHVVTEGFVAFHDSTDPNIGPIKLIRELVATGAWEIVEQLHGTTVLRRT
jgi:hypothetical protein